MLSVVAATRTTDENMEKKLKHREGWESVPESRSLVHKKFNETTMVDLHRMIKQAQCGEAMIRFEASFSICGNNEEA